MRLGFSIAAFLEADILLLDEVFAVGDESFQRKCFGVISAFKQRGGTILFVSHEASAVERLCDRARAPARRERHLRRLGARGARPLPPRARRGRDRRPGRDRSPATAEIIGARLVGADGAPRETFLAGEPLRLEVEVGVHAPEPGLALQLNVRDTAGLLVVDDARRARPRWLGRPGRCASPSGWTSRGPRSTSAASASSWRCSAAMGRLLHRADDEPSLLVYPDGAGRGLVRLEGTWSALANESTT